MWVAHYAVQYAAAGYLHRSCTAVRRWKAHTNRLQNLGHSKHVAGGNEVMCARQKELQ